MTLSVCGGNGNENTQPIDMHAVQYEVSTYSTELLGGRSDIFYTSEPIANFKKGWEDLLSLSLRYPLNELPSPCCYIIQ